MLRALGLSEEQVEGSRKEEPAPLLSGATPRKAMQELGTAWGRSLHPDFWVNLWRQEAIKDPRVVVVDDCRFPNEALAIRALGGVIIEIRRPGDYDLLVSHSSEEQYFEADMRVLNEGFNRDVLFARLDGALEIWLENQNAA
jgi:hypothetical protein